jgi:hypothetical protein
MDKVWLKSCDEGPGILPSSDRHTKPCNYFFSETHVSGARRSPNFDVVAPTTKQVALIENNVILSRRLTRSVEAVYQEDAQVITSSRRASITVGLLLASTPSLGPITGAK